VRRATEWAASSDVLDPMSGRLEPAGQRGLFDEPISVPASAPQDDVEVVDARGREALGGPRFGELVHALLASTPLNADRTQLDALAEVHGRVLAAPPEEVGAAAAVVERLLNHPLLRRARAADARSACRRETPATIVMPDGVLVEGIVDLAFEEDGRWVVVDYKTDRELEGIGEERYRRQVALYASAIARATGQPASAVLIRV